jgi:hypothetical protein
MVYKAIMASLTEEAKNSINLFKEEFHIGREPSGLLLLRVIIRESHLDSNAATSVIRLQLSQLDQYMKLVNSHIGKFHKHARTQGEIRRPTHQSLHRVQGCVGQRVPPVRKPSGIGLLRREEVHPDAINGIDEYAVQANGGQMTVGGTYR